MGGYFHVELNDDTSPPEDMKVDSGEGKEGKDREVVNLLRSDVDGTPNESSLTPILRRSGLDAFFNFCITRLLVGLELMSKLQVFDDMGIAPVRDFRAAPARRTLVLLVRTVLTRPLAQLSIFLCSSAPM